MGCGIRFPGIKPGGKVAPIPACAAKALYPIIKRPRPEAKGRPAGKLPGVVSPLPFRKKVLYYGLMLLLTLLAIEGMARLAYYAAYGSGYSRGGLEEINDFAPPPLQPSVAKADRWQLRHPFYGYTSRSPDHDLSAMPPRQRREDTVVIGLLGGSLAQEAQPYLQRALDRHFAANNRPRQPVVLGLATGALKQPQHTLIVAHTLLLGGDFDLIVNLDGLNEVVGSVSQSREEGVFPFFPWLWNKRGELTSQELRLAGQVGALRREQARLAQRAATSPLRRSALFGLANRYRRERIAAEIIQRNHELAAAPAQYALEKHGPRTGLGKEERLLPAAARVWYRGSLALARLAELGGAEYYHFLQPNQYAPDSKPLSPEELEVAYSPESYTEFLVAKGYPLLLEFGQELPGQGVNYFDLTRIFAAHPETLYRDICCHLNARGYELLAAAMVQRMEPALLRLGGASPAGPVSALAAARRLTPPDALLVDAAFRVYLQGDGQWLRYGRDACVAADAELRFFLHLTPRDLADLPPHRRSHGFDNLDFSFAKAGGKVWQGQCRAQIRLPDYPIAHLRTGQYAPYAAGELWVGEYAFPE